ncbi:hypothetical protein JGU66_30275 [Myxococcaceae bacterium JPH2]|nr:hypothetical protein [Myxococcaceae bacterium JPH2]
MNVLRTALFTGVGFLLSLAPLSAQAAISCDACDCETPCATRCVSGHRLTYCADFGLTCKEQCVGVAGEQHASRDDAAQSQSICREDLQAEEAAARAKS